ncbi:MAG: hypothetical protein JHC33_06175 [Ignisphaera sp.]|nr:hypothetical protein [Ignisphaera sp.]
MNLKQIKIDELSRIIDSSEKMSSVKVGELKPIKIHPETYRTLKRIQKANNIKSIYRTIDLLVMTTALAQMSDSDYEYKKFKQRIIA